MFDSKKSDEYHHISNHRKKVKVFDLCLMIFIGISILVLFITGKYSTQKNDALVEKKQKKQKFAKDHADFSGKKSAKKSVYRNISPEARRNISIAMINSSQKTKVEEIINSGKKNEIRILLNTLKNKTTDAEKIKITKKIFRRKYKSDKDLATTSLIWLHKNLNMKNDSKEVVLKNILDSVEEEVAIYFKTAVNEYREYLKLDKLFKNLPKVVENNEKNSEKIAPDKIRNSARIARFKTDSDGDGLSDWEEINVYGTDPDNPDTDGEGVRDGDEVYTYSTDPLNPDSDTDLSTDYNEIFVDSTNPNDPDSDSDNVIDGLDNAPNTADTTNQAGNGNCTSSYTSAITQTAKNGYEEGIIGSVDGKTREYIHRKVDMAVPSSVFPIIITSTFRSSSITNGVFGKGWTTNITQHLFLNGSDVIYKDADGILHTYTASGSNWISPSYRHDTLTGDWVSGFTLNFINGSSITFNTDGKVTRFENRLGNYLIIDYHTTYTKLNNNAGDEVIIWKYLTGRWHFIENAMGYGPQNEYNSNNYREDEILPDTVDETNISWSYSYSAGNSSNTLLTSITDPYSETRESISYDAITDEVDSITDGGNAQLSFSNSGSDLIVTESVDATTDYTRTVSFNTDGTPSEVSVDYQGIRSSYTTGSFDYSYQYDSDRDVTRYTMPAGNYVSLTRNSVGKVTQKQLVPKSGSGDPTLTWSYTLDSSNWYLVTQITDPKSNNTYFKYDFDEGGTTDYNNDGSNNGTTGGNVGLLFCIKSDNINNGVQTSDIGDPWKMMYRYESTYNLLYESEDANDYIVRLNRDSSGEISSIIKDPTVSRSTHANITTSFTTNAINQVTQITQPNSHSYTISFNSWGQAYKCEDSISILWEKTFNKNGQCTQIDMEQRDEDDNFVRNYSETYSYNDEGLLTSITKDFDSSDNFVIDYTYWNNRQIKTVTENLKSSKTHVSYFKYDERITIGAGFMHTSASTYDANGAETARHQSSGRTWDFTRNAIDQLTNIRIGMINYATFVYQGSGTKETSRFYANTASLSNTFDTFGRINSSSWTTTFSTISDFDYTFDDEDNVTLIARNHLKNMPFDPVGTLTTITLDEVDRMTRIQDVYLMGAGTTKSDISFNQDGVLKRSSVTDNTTMTTDSYTSNNDCEYSAINLTNRIYDNNGNLIDDGTFEYQYDGFNNLVNIIDKATGNLFINYIFDGMSRMVGRKQYDVNTTALISHKRWTYRGWQKQESLSLCKNSLQVLRSIRRMQEGGNCVRLAAV